jgi:glucose/arabinose dehydrogenase
MPIRTQLVVSIGLIVFITACSEAQPTALFLPTSPPRPTSSPTPAPTAIPTLTSESPMPATPTPDQPTVEATHTALPTDAASPTVETTHTAVPTDTAPPTPEQVTAEPTPTVTTQPPAEVFPPVIGLEPWLTGFEAPVYITYAADTSPWESRLFVVEKSGRIQLVENGQVRTTPFLDITDRVGSSSSEQGLLSVAFPPDFETSQVFYVNYTDKGGNTVVSRFRMLGGDSPQGDPSSEKKLLEIAQPAANHNGGQLQFGPDGYLYIGTGDGGSAGDPWGNAQNPDALLGKMLRIDVGGDGDYRIPHDNPFLEWPNVRSEIWALGLRNPWRFSFDRITGDLYNAYEEVDFQPAYSTGGENYGWNTMEANHCYQPQSGCETTGLIRPVAEYDHSQGCSITGGYVYRGENYPNLRGVYLFGDFCSGNIWGLRQTSSGEWDKALLLDSGLAISSFGQDVQGELYVTDYRDGSVHRLIALR